MPAVHAGESPAGAAEPTFVRDARELYAALDGAGFGQRIVLTGTRYDLDQPLSIPDGVALDGRGTMAYDTSGAPLGLGANGSATLRVSRHFSGDALTLEDGASIRGLRIEELVNQPAEGLNRAGNVVAVLSRKPADSVSAVIRECEILNPNEFGIGATGPDGRAILVLTRQGIANTSAHQGAVVKVTVERSIIRSRNSNTLFAANFATRGRIDLELADNVFEGSLAASGGVARQDEVSQAQTHIVSRHNLYQRVAGYDGMAWGLLGASSGPHVRLPDKRVLGNTLRMSSTNDRLEGFRIGILMAAGRRVREASADVSDNRAQLDMRGGSISTLADGADLVLHGALAVSAEQNDDDFAIGDRNELRVSIRETRGSGPRANAFSNVTGPILPADRGRGNQLLVIGSPDLFKRSNPGIEPVPGCCWDAQSSDLVVPSPME